MRPLPGVSWANCGEMAVGKVTPFGAVTVGCAGSLVKVASVGAGTVSSSAAPAPHSALRKSFHFMPFSLLAVFAAWYLVLHSAMDRPLAELSEAAAVEVLVAAGLVALVAAGLVSVAAAAAPAAHSVLRK